nr:unnamed protein product [Digitaria exilis]
MAPRDWCRLTMALFMLLIAGGDAIETLYIPPRTACPPEGGYFSSGSMFQVNADGLAHSLSMGAAVNGGFLNTSYGDPRDKSFGVIWCFADIGWAECKKCLERAPSYVSTACPRSRTGTLLYKECVLPYSDEVSVNMRNMMNQLIREAAMSPQQLAVANGSQLYNGPTGVYGLLQCRRDLTPEECTKCLSYQVQYLLENFRNNIAAYIKGVSCFSKYHPEPITFMVPPDKEFRNGTGPKGFSYDVLAAATSNFSDHQKLGEGGFGSVYDIVLGIGSALLYLHQECEQGVLHRDIKLSNVMLDGTFNAKLGDFGLARLVNHSRGTHTTEQLTGTMGYMDPDCAITGRFSTESDIYSFGVLLLEVACGRQPVLVTEDNTVIHLARRVSDMYGRGVILDAADCKLNGDLEEEQMMSVLVVGLWCTQQERSLRPSIRQAISVLRCEAPLPTLAAVAQLGSVPSFIVDDSTATTTTYLRSTI